jgi:hypothetical protein
MGHDHNDLAPRLRSGTEQRGTAHDSQKRLYRFDLKELYWPAQLGSNQRPSA